MATHNAKLRGFIHGAVGPLQERYIQAQPAAKARLAHLRQQANKPLGESPETWEVFSESFPPELIGKGTKPSAAESAAFMALTLFAIHMQSKNAPMHVEGEGIGKALRRYAATTGDDLFESSVYRRFNSVVQAQTLEALSYHLRALIKLFRSEDVPLDYAQLASDLYRIQFADSKTSVHLSWARQLYRTETPQEGNTNV